jgi:hypothetical protein
LDDDPGWSITIVLEKSFFLTKIWAHRIFCFNIVITCII